MCKGFQPIESGFGWWWVTVEVVPGCGMIMSSLFCSEHQSVHLYTHTRFTLWAAASAWAEGDYPQQIKLCSPRMSPTWSPSWHLRREGLFQQREWSAFSVSKVIITLAMGVWSGCSVLSHYLIFSDLGGKKIINGGLFLREPIWWSVF